MDIRKLQRVIVDALEDVKAQRIEIFNTESQSPLFERVLIASGSSNRQTKALAASVCDAVKSNFSIQPRVEGEENGEWIIVDCGPAVVHVMQPAIRDYYHLEEIWGAKPVRLKTAAVSKALPKASEPEGEAGRAVAKKAAAKKAVASKVNGQAVPAKKAPAKKAAVKKPVAKKATLEASATTKAPARKTAAKPNGAKKTTAVKKPAAKKVSTAAAKKPAAKKSSSAA